MARVEVSPIGLKYQRVPDWLLPCPAPVFSDDNPTDLDRQFACELIAALDSRSRRWYEGYMGRVEEAAPAPVWDTSCVDWEQRLIEGRPIIPAPIYPGQAEQALKVFKRLKVVDVAGRPTFGECADQWVFDYVAAIFGAYDARSAQQLIREFFMLISKKNTKSTIAAGIMLTSVILCWREEEEHLILAPTKEVADNSFKPVAAMVRADDELNSLFHVQGHLRTISHRISNASLKVVAADTDTVSGKKSGRILVEELWAFGKKANADAMLMEALGGQVARPEAWVIYLTTQADDAPAGVFRDRLQYFRAVRDGRIQDKRSLGVLYEFPQAMLDSKGYLNPDNFYITNPNLGRSVSKQWLQEELSKLSEQQDGTLQKFLAKHLNVEIGLALRSDRWAGADFWQQCAGERVELAELCERCEVVDLGIDGGGLDDLLGMAAIGRLPDGNWLHWAKAWAHPSVLERRKQEAARFHDFQRDGDLALVQQIGDDVDEVADLAAMVEASGKLDKIGVDPHGLGGILDALMAEGVPEDKVVGISQGWKLTGAIKTLERRLAEGSITHSGTPLMAWSVGNAKVEPRGNAITITKQAAGYAKIDPLMATFNAVSLMALNPQGIGKSFWETA